MVAALIEKFCLKMLKMKNILSIGIFATLLFSCLGQEDDDFTALFDGRNLDEWILGPEGGFEIIKKMVLQLCASPGIYVIGCWQQRGSHTLQSRSCLGNRGRGTVAGTVDSMER
jgi:hypothetical protein